MLLQQTILSPHGFGAWFESLRTHPTQSPAPQPGNQPARFHRPPGSEQRSKRQFCTLVHHCLQHDLPIRVILLKPRQKGCSTISVAFLYWLVRRFGLQGMIIGGQYDQTDELWKILQRYHTYDSFPWPARGVIQDYESQIHERRRPSPNATALNENAGRAGTYQAVIVTELGR